jgi:effector-binding domain-containing protein
LQKKTIGQQPVLFKSQCLTIPEVAAYAEKYCADILAESESLGMEIAGPWIFISYNLPENPYDQFQIDFFLPVRCVDDVPESDCQVKILNQFTCISNEYTGDLANLFNDGYGPLLDEARRNKYALSGEVREVYIDWLGARSENNCIEIQFGLLGAQALA